MVIMVLSLLAKRKYVILKTPLKSPQGDNLLSSSLGLSPRGDFRGVK